MKKNSFWGWSFFIFLAVTPLFIWAFIQPLPQRFSDPITTLTSFGRVMGLLGLSLFSLVFILNSRLRVLDTIFWGLGNAYKAHHILGGIAFVLLLFHPLFLSFSLIPSSLQQAALFLLPGRDWVNTLGSAALTLMMMLLILTFYVRLPYHVWKYTHQFLGVAFFFGVLHSLFVRSDISSDIFLRSYLLILSGLGLAAYFYRTVAGNFLVKRSVYFIDEVNDLGSQVVEIRLTTKTGAMSYQPGQFAYFRVFNKSLYKEAHPFSMSSAPNDSFLRFSVKALGDYTNQLLSLKKGEEAQIEGPFGKFSYLNYRGKRLIWIGGGIGITPFLSMARALRKGERKVDLYYSVSDKKEGVYSAELNQLARKKNFQLITVVSEKDGRLTAGQVRKRSGYIQKAEIFICGPSGMMAALRKQFLQLGLPDEKIHTEEFSY